ncbi:MAG: T9SS type A sorting domain-containing protein [Flavobacteriales bacterium]|nr:T9SS type A sorting domain-containing protein [Flavobacteriales bacterium]
MMFFFDSEAQIIKEGLVGYWPFNGNANDESNQGNNGVVKGATLAYDRYGRKDSAYYFDGNNDYIDLGRGSSLYPSSITLNLWFKYNNQHQTGVMVSCTNSNNGEWGVSMRVQEDQLYGVKSALGAGGNNRAIGHTIGRIYDFSWHMITLVYDNSSNLTCKTYFDGFFAGNHNYYGVSGDFGNQDYLQYDKSMNWLVGAQPQYFFSSGSNGPQYFQGYLDDISIFNRPLSAKEIEMLYSGYSSDTCVVTVFDTISVAVTDTLFIKIPTKANNPCELMVYPNPTRDVLFVDASKCNHDIYTLKIFNDIGQLVYQSLIGSSGSKLVDLQGYDFAEGVYLLKILNKSDEIVMVKKIVLY